VFASISYGGEISLGHITSFFLQAIGFKLKLEKYSLRHIFKWLYLSMTAPSISFCKISNQDTIACVFLLCAIANLTLWSDLCFFIFLSRYFNALLFLLSAYQNDFILMLKIYFYLIFKRYSLATSDL
jgi:hypothetical protein